MRLILRTLGDLALHTQEPGDAPVRSALGGKPLALLVHLALSPDRSADRSRLLDLLWSDLAPDAARNSLRVTLTKLRKLGPDVFGPTVDPVVLTAAVESDYHALGAAWARSDMEGVVEAFTGDLLPAFALPGADEFESWADGERRRVRAMFVRAAEAVVRARLSAGRFRDAERLARRVRALDPSQDVGWRLVLECLLASRDALELVLEVDELQRLLAGEALTLEPGTELLLAQARQLVTNAGADARARVASLPEVVPPLVAELVGREQEFAAIMRAWATASAGHVAHVHLVAPAGLGKTRLLTDVQARLRAARARVVHLAAAHGTRDIAYGLASDLATALGTRRGARGVSRDAAGALVALTPALSTHFDAPRDPATGEEALRRRALAVRELLAALTEEQPLALLLDDLHWADPLSLRLLATAFHGLGAGRLLVLSTARHTPDALSGVLDDRTVRLLPLSEEAIARLLESLAALPTAAWAGELPAALHRATAGSPLLVLETLALLRERGLLAIVGEQWAAVDAERVAAELRAGSALRHRLGQLAPEQRDVLLLLATAGVPLGVERLAAASGAVASGPGDPAARTRASLAALEQRGLVACRDALWSTAHDEHAATLLEMTPEPEVRAAEAAAGRVIAEGAADDPRACQLAARLLSRGGDHAALAALLARVVRQRRLAGDPRRDRALAAELLGRAVDDAAVSTLVRTLPWPVRARLVTGRRIAAAVTVALLAPPSVAVAVRLARAGASRPPEAVLLAVRPSADHSAMEMLEVPLDADALASARPVDVDLARRPSWRVPDSVMRNVQAGRTSRPDGRGWVMARSVADSGVLDLFDVRPGVPPRRLTYARLDDMEPDWAPDGSRLVFVTTRWTTTSGYDLAVYDARTGGVRPLTGPDDASDESAFWSPDGSRIVFTRTEGATGAWSRCVVDADGGHPRCVRLPHAVGLLGWADARHVFAQRSLRPGEGGGASAAALALLRIDVDTGEEVVLRTDVDGAYFPSPDGRWVYCRCRRPGAPADVWSLFAADMPELLTPVHVRPPAAAAAAAILWAPTSPRRAYLDTLRIVPGPGRPVAGVPHQLRAAGVDRDGRPADVGVVRWRSLDTAAATVDSTGLLRPRRVGAVVVEASAGGWRTARASIVVVANETRVLLDERWTDGLTPAWRPFGRPLPTVERSATLGPDLARGFANNGEGSFWSGAYLARAFDVRDGLWAEATLSVPLTAVHRSQEQLFALFAFADPERWATWDHATGDHPVARQCRLRYPLAYDRPSGGDSLVVESPIASRNLRVPRRLRDGAPFRALVQIFPDGRCGFAVDGRPLWTSPPGYVDEGARVMLYGNSQGTRVLVGALRVSAGIAPHVAWAAADSAIVAGARGAAAR